MLIDDVKVIIGETSTEHDEVLGKLCEIYANMAGEYCNVNFKEPYRAGVKKFVADCIEYGKTTGLTGRTMGTVSYSYVSDVPQTLYKSLRPLKQLSWGKYHENEV